jgi:hypothetical protein
MSLSLLRVSADMVKLSTLRQMYLLQWMSEVVNEHLSTRQHLDTNRNFLCFAEPSSEKLSQNDDVQLEELTYDSSLSLEPHQFNLCTYGRPFEAAGEGWKYFEGVRIGQSFFIVKALYRESSAELSVDIYHTGTSGIVRLSTSALKKKSTCAA